MDEIDYQRRIANAIKAKGYYAKKWSSQWSVGVPDLIVVAGIATGFYEVKLEKKWLLNTRRTIGLTPKQTLELNEIKDGGGRSRVLIIVSEKEFGPIRMVVCKPPPVGEQLAVYRDDLLKVSFTWDDLKNNPVRFLALDPFMEN